MKKLFRRLLILALISAALGIAVVGVTYLVLEPDLPDVETLRDVQLQVPLRVFSEDGKLMGIFGEKRRIPVTVGEMPDLLKQAFLAGEDARFYEHPGLDYQGITRAVWSLLTTGEKSIGGSTITQQLARNFFLSAEKTWTRKIKEAFLALKIERELEKDEILELYLNKIFLGYRAYGVGAAAEVYYGKSTGQLSLAQCAMIAALPKAPSRINPINSPERALERRNYVLRRMHELGYIEEARMNDALEQPDRAYYHGAIAEISAPYVAEMVRVLSLDVLGPEAYTGGYVVTTTIDSRLQTAANLAVSNGLEEYDQRHGFRGPEAHVDLDETAATADWDEILSPHRPVSGLEPGLVIETEEELALVYLRNGQTAALALEDMAWAAPFIDRDRKGSAPKVIEDIMVPGDIVRTRLHDDGRWKLGQLPEVESALVSLDPRSGDIKALVGGYDFARSKYNRIIQGKRQPGSSFKPFIYSAALNKGFTVASLINDAPIVFEDSELERTWKPQNFSEKFYGPTRLREAMVNSRNLVSIRLLRDIGIDYARDYTERFGFDRSEMPANLSMALGSASLTPLSMARGYAVFANGGYLVGPQYVRRIADASGRIVYETMPSIICDRCEPQDTATDSEALAEQKMEPDYRPLEIASEPGQLEVTQTGNSDGATTSRFEQSYAQQTISPQNAYLVRSMMMDVVKRGTGVRAMQLGRADLAGKTGTTNEQRDAWFSGYNDHLVTSVWVGFDNHEPLGRNELGGRAALPVWMEFMAVALEGVEDKPPPMPEGLSQAKIDPESGLLARLENNNGIMELFEAGTLPAMQETGQGEDQDVPLEENPYEIY
ncbi:MAG: penicillin-binding protein 1A [Xanthomonadales bacterium]|nr:penicillin-binding protein 1A [Gammaproteobacteria bacterium]MBT8055086.1 penicillin-binding protein 1A [Gammaproteobacteria bacterium]NND58239.1 penicillin-binding protein 1A [Xanthomonadales bacterium]NNK51680.1 penicillin-binding protein 1A [Xanthomonadales bacterium]